MSIDIERSLLAAVFQDPPSIALVADRVRPEHFTNTQHRELYATMLEMYKSNAPINLQTVTEGLSARESLGLVGADFVGGLYNDVTSSAPSALDHYAAALIEGYAQHQLYSASQAAQVALEKPGAKSLEVANGLSGVINDVTGTLEKSHPQRIGEILPDTFAAIDRAAATPDGVMGVHTGFPDLDDILGGMRAGQVILLAARPAEGKTALAANIAANAALDHGKTVAYFTLEMTKEEVAMRLLSALAVWVASSGGVGLSLHTGSP